MVARAHEKIRNKCLNLHHQLSYELICENQAISYAVEVFGIKNMIRNHKEKWYLAIGRFMSSFKVCLQIIGLLVLWLKKKPLHIRTWQCPNCETVHDRDGISMPQ